MAETDRYQGQGESLLAFGDELEVITPSDGTDLPKRYKAILVGGTGGAVVIHDKNGSTRTLFGIAGMVLQGVRPRRILSSGTVATPLFGVV